MFISGAQNLPRGLGGLPWGLGGMKYGEILVTICSVVCELDRAINKTIKTFVGVIL